MDIICIWFLLCLQASDSHIKEVKMRNQKHDSNVADSIKNRCSVSLFMAYGICGWHKVN